MKKNEKPTSSNNPNEGDGVKDQPTDPSTLGGANAPRGANPLGDAPEADEAKKPPPVLDPFDPKYLRLSQDFTVSAGVVKLLTTVPIRKPDRQWFIRVRPGSDWRLSTCVVELKEERETYLVKPELRSLLPDEVISKVIYTAINRQGVVFLWAVRLPGADGRHDEWNRSAMDAAERAASKWVRVVANMSLGAYEVFEATGDLPDPEWPVNTTFAEILKIAFKEKYIDSLDHPVVKRLRGLNSAPRSSRVS